MSADRTTRDSDPRDSFAHYRGLMRSHGFHPSRRLGQNFLLDPSLHRILVAAAAPTPADLVLEVGPGLGFLTRELAAAHCRVVAVEIDDRLVRLLSAEFDVDDRPPSSPPSRRPSSAGAAAAAPTGGAPRPRFRLVHADVLQRSRLNPAVLEVLREERAAGAAGRFLVAANLPYAIAGPLLAELSLMETPPERIVVLVQLELAQRLAASSGTREYGALTVQMQLGYDIEILRRVGREVFRPRPQVDSAIVRLQRRAGCLDRPPAERRAMGGFWRQLFAARRKKLRNAKPLRELGPRADVLGDDLLQLRPDAIPPAEMLRIWDLVGTAPDG